jgi:hypothetical protein
MKGPEMRFIAIIYAAGASLALSGCVTTKDVKSNGNDMALGQTANIDGPRIKIVKILEDSRCPINARCIQAGTVKLQILWLRPDGNQSMELILGQAKPMADGTITFTSVTPGRMAGGPEIKPTDYRLSLEFAGGLLAEQH